MGTSYRDVPYEGNQQHTLQTRHMHTHVYTMYTSTHKHMQDRHICLCTPLYTYTQTYPLHLCLHAHMPLVLPLIQCLRHPPALLQDRGPPLRGLLPHLTARQTRQHRRGHCDIYCTVFCCVVFCCVVLCCMLLSYIVSIKK